MILTSNRGFAEWGEVFGDPVRATGSVNTPIWYRAHSISKHGLIIGCERNP